MTSKIHPKIIGLLLLSVIALVFFLYSLRQASSEADTAIESLNRIQLNTTNVEEVKALIAEENSAAGKYMFSEDSAWYNSMMMARRKISQRIADMYIDVTGNNKLLSSSVTLKQLLARSYAIQDSLIGIKKNTLTAEKILIGDSINSIIAVLVRYHHEQHYTRRQAFADEIRSNIVRTLIGGIIVFIIIIIILARLNRDNRRLKFATYRAGESENKYRSLIENAGPVMYTADLNGYITFASQKATVLTGYPNNELMGMHISKLIEPAIVNDVLNNYINQIKKRIHETVLHFTAITKQGAQKSVGQSAILIMEGEKPVGFQCSVWDLNEMAQVRLDLQESEENLRKNTFQLQSILDNTDAVIYIKDIEGHYQIVNRRFIELIGVTEEAVINHTDYAFSSRERADHYRELDEKVIQTKKPYESEEEIDGPNGKLHLLLGKFPLLDENNKVSGICGIATDITERINYQQELILARSTAEGAKLFQEQFLANVSHEIRTPMNGILGMTNLLLDSSLNTEQLEFVSFIKRCVNNLLVLINDILDFSKIQAGKLSIEQIPFDLMKIVENLRMDFSHRIKEKGLAFNIHVDANIPKILVGDPYRLTQVLINFVGNAIKFTEQGSVELYVNLSEKRINDVLIEFAIEDTGIGIPQENLSSIFESFNQGNTATTRIYGGTGLGLAISKQLIEMQHGAVSVTSTLGKGSRFVANIPYNYTNDEIMGEQQAVAKTDYAFLLKGKKILAAEDNEVNQRLLIHVLQKINVEVDLAANGEEAIEMLRQKNYDIVLMDIQMPVMDGYTATIYIRNEMHMQIPILAMTATALKGELEKCLAVGMNDYMSKPFTFEDLYGKILRLTAAGETTALVKPVQTKETAVIYNLSFLEDMGDKNTTLEMISLVISNTSGQLLQIQDAMKNKEWEQVTHFAHKAKSSVGMLHATELLKLLAQIEEYSKEENKRDELTALYKKALAVYHELETMLKLDQERLRVELGLND